MPGVGDVTVFGAGKYGMRIWLDPEQLKARGLTTEDVLGIVQQQNQQVAAGAGRHAAGAGGPGLPVHAQRQRAAERRAGVRGHHRQGRTRRTAAASPALRDVARVELGAQIYGQSFTLNGQPAAGLGIFQLPEANALTVAKRGRAPMARARQDLPAGPRLPDPVRHHRPSSTASIHEVYKTLFEAGVLVLIVILVFLQDWRAMLVPATTVPVTIIGAFAAMAALGFSRQPARRCSAWCWPSASWSTTPS